jgi:hypothetical protein
MYLNKISRLATEMYVHVGKYPPTKASRCHKGEKIKGWKVKRGENVKEKEEKTKDKGEI